MKNKITSALNVALFLTTSILLISIISFSIIFGFYNAPMGNVLESGQIWGNQGKNGYNAWPSTCTLNGKIYCTFSGERLSHTKGSGKVMLSTADENSLTWQTKVVYESDYDERDCGILNLGNGKMLLSFITWVRPGVNYYPKYMLSNDYGETWSEPYNIEIHSPHGPTKLKNGNIVYLGKNFVDHTIHSMISSDGGATWVKGTSVPLPKDVSNDNLHEPFTIELSDGSLLGAVKYLSKKSGKYFKTTFFYTRSYDGGQTWTELEYSDINGIPPHLIETSSGKIVVTYARREFPYSLRYKVSNDNGNTFGKEFKLCDQFSWDFGYPCTVELSDGSLLTVYYGKRNVFEDKTNIYYIKWQL